MPAHSGPERILCRICGVPVNPEELVLCAKCEAPAHNLCWAERGWCPIRSCGSPTMKRRDGLETPPPSAAPGSTGEPASRAVPAPSRLAAARQLAPPAQEATKRASGQRAPFARLAQTNGEDVEASGPQTAALRSRVSRPVPVEEDEDAEAAAEAAANAETEALRKRISKMQSKLDELEVPPIHRVLLNVGTLALMVAVAVWLPDAIMQPTSLVGIAILAVFYFRRASSSRGEASELRAQLESEKMRLAGSPQGPGPARS